ncbi:hypothetical protein [Delftia acidovorans]|jgi:hypothetical protein
MEHKQVSRWERIEPDYSAGIKSLRQIAAEQGISEEAIRKRAKLDDWSRDLLERIQDKAEQLVRKDAYAARYARNALRPKLRWWTRMPGCAGCGQDRAGPQARYPARRATASAQCHLPANDFS